MDRNTFNSLISSGRWQELFISQMGWNKPKGPTTLPTIDIYTHKSIAQRNGFQVLLCEVEALPTMSICRQIDRALRRQANDYICIYALQGTEHHIWACPLVHSGKREMVLIEYSDLKQTQFLYEKIGDLSFEIEEQTTIVDVRQRVSKAFSVNSETLTKKFYEGFQKQHKIFAGFISGIEDQLELYDRKNRELNRNKLYYASVMLNRLMFCYFIQKKGFLDGDTDYLNNRLQQVRQEEGEGKFYGTFYRNFLISLFHDGLNSPRHNREWEHRFGRIPYLNGGMFDVHSIEREYENIDISDEAFISLFKFFDTWQWHLDTRITASGRDINPDVLGYIFEQYINDRSAMGAYYTKEDITEYISKNCILPFLMDRVAESSSRESFRPRGYVWKSLSESGSKYIYPAMLRGYSENWREKLPENIARGLISEQMKAEYCFTPVGELPQEHVPLLKLRSDWNTPTPAEVGLPTEIWRETLERFERVDTLKRKISSGEITRIDEFITLNLDIRSFVYDLLAQTQDHIFVKNFYSALKKITILDPTCGSGAFLFAALGILEPLYEVCIERMEEFNKENPRLFVDELSEIQSKYRSNIQYFIYKSIILRNLYGVDIMAEATEIARLRLFLKMVAVVEVDYYADNLGLDPLPDIDFNIRCGNTLVGYACEEEMLEDLKTDDDLFASLELQNAIKKKNDAVAGTYNTFKDIQLSGKEDKAEFASAKAQLTEELATLNKMLNRRLFEASGAVGYDSYIKNVRPFHWYAEFHSIMAENGGFDVVIGNPPYVKYNEKNFDYKLSEYQSLKANNLYAFCIERVLSLVHKSSLISMIVPVTMSCGKNFEVIRNLLNSRGGVFYSHYAGDTNPGTMFNGVKQNLTIFISTPRTGQHTTNFIKFYNSYRPNNLFTTLEYGDVIVDLPTFRVNKEIQKNVLTKILKGRCLYNWFGNDTSAKIYFKNTSGSQYKTFFDKLPFFEVNGEQSVSSTFDNLSFLSGQNGLIALSILNSNLFNLWWWNFSDTRHVTGHEIDNFRVPDLSMLDDSLPLLAKSLMKDLDAKKNIAKYNKQKGITRYAQFFPRLSKPIIDQIDIVLAKHYGFTDEELDFIVNYDIKYRMGDELNHPDPD